MKTCLIFLADFNTDCADSAEFVLTQRRGGIRKGRRGSILASFPRSKSLFHVPYSMIQLKMIFFIRLQRMRARVSYDTSLKHLYRIGLEDVIPMSLRKKIPRNNIHRWRNEKEGKYEGYDLNDLAKSEIQLLKEFLKSKNARRIFTTYVRIGRFIEKVAGEKVIRKQFKKHKADLIDVVERARQTLPLKQVLKCFSMSESTYNQWVLGMYTGCSKSLLDWFLVRQPHQLKEEEIKKMEELLTDETIHF